MSKSVTNVAMPSAARNPRRRSHSSRENPRSRVSQWLAPLRRVASSTLRACALLPLLATAPKAMADYTVPSHMQWWSDARFGMFIHFGTYSHLGQGEWSMHWGGYSKQNYQTQVSQPFNPTSFDANAIVSAAKTAGMKYIVITAKHHEGFAMWNRTTATSFKDYSGSTIYSLPAYTNSHFSRDILMELKNECVAQGLKFCLYYSILDWNHSSQTKRNQGPALTTMSSLAARSAYIADMKNDLDELITRYDPALLWFDGDWFGEPASPTLEDWWLSSDGQDLYNFVKSKKDTIIVNERVKRDLGLGDYAVAEFGTPSAPMSRPWERCDTMNGAWGYDASKENATSYRPAKELVQSLVINASREGNLLLNIGPDGTGTMSAYAADRLNGIGAWTSVWGSSIYGTTRSPFSADPSWGTYTKKDGYLYCHVFTYPSGNPKTITVPGITNTITGVYALKNPGTALDYTVSGGNFVVTLPNTNPDSTGTDAVIVIACSGIPVAAPPPALASGTYKIVNRNSSKVMWPSGTSNGSNVQQKTLSGGNAYKWTVQDIGGGQYSIKNLASGKAIGVFGASTADGTNAVVWDSNSSNDQKWKIIPLGGGYYKIENVNSGKVAGIYGASTVSGAAVIQWTWPGGLDQQWSFQP
jgi:alpha-L-fucosidase